MQLYGTTTSPFVRRVRVVAAACGEPVELVNTAPDAGQAALRAISPIAKVPVAVIDGRTLLDSITIIDWLRAHRGGAGLTTPVDAWHERNLVSAIDAALDAAISTFYLKRDGVDVDALARTAVQRARVTTILTWLDGQLAPGATRLVPGPADQLDLPTLSLLCTLDWMAFRDAHPITGLPGLASVRAAWTDHPLLVATRPHV